MCSSDLRTYHQGWPMAKLSARNHASVRRCVRSSIWGRSHSDELPSYRCTDSSLPPTDLGCTGHGDQEGGGGVMRRCILKQEPISRRPTLYTVSTPALPAQASLLSHPRIGCCLCHARPTRSSTETACAASALAPPDLDIQGAESSPASSVGDLRRLLC